MMGTAGGVFSKLARIKESNEVEILGIRRDLLLWCYSLGKWFKKASMEIDPC